MVLSQANLLVYNGDQVSRALGRQLLIVKAYAGNAASIFSTKTWSPNSVVLLSTKNHSNIWEDSPPRNKLISSLNIISFAVTDISARRRRGKSF